MNETWLQIGKILSAIAPEIAQTLNLPASQDQVSSLEQRLDVSLPESFKSYLLTFDGQHLDYLMPLLGYNCFLSIKEIIEFWEMQVSTFEDEEIISHLTENKVKPMFWNKKWIPISDFEASNRLILDLDPGKNGLSGQIIKHYPGVDLESNEIVVANSFDEFSKEILKRLSENKFKINDGVIEFDDYLI